MNGTPHDWLQPLQRLWRSWAQGELSLVLDPAPRESGDASESLSPEARRDLFGTGALGHWREGERRWWSAPMGGENGRHRYLAGWSVADGPWGDLLLAWAGLLGQAFSEHEVADVLTEELTRAWDQLKFVYQLIQVASEADERSDSLGAAVRLTADFIHSDDGFLAARSPEGKWRFWTAHGTAPVGLEAVAEAAWARKRPLRLPDLSEQIAVEAPALQGVADLFVVPVWISGETTAVLGVLRSGERYSASEVQLVVSAAEQIGLLMEGSRVREAREAARRVELEISLASRIQASMLPSNLPAVAGLDLSAHVRPAFHFGGDFYDVARAPSGEILLLLGDVSGKGIGAAMLTALVHASFQSLVPGARDPARLLSAMNRLMRPDLERAQAFVTAVVLRLDLDAAGFAYASAGHTPAAFWRASRERVEMLPATGLPLGIFPETEYAVRRQAMRPGDVVVLYSDGVTEALDGSGKLLGQQGLADLLFASHAATAHEQVRFFLEALDLYRGDRPLLDDVALLLVRRDHAPPSSVVVPFVFPAERSAVGSTVDLVRRVGESLPMESAAARQKATDDFSLALAEVVSNQVRHAYERRPGRIQGSLELSPRIWSADLYDIGRPFEGPRTAWAVPDPADPPLGGYGLHMVNGLVESCVYRRLGGVRNHWHLRKELPGG